MSKKKPQIFKIQRSLNRERMLIYNKKRTVMAELPYNNELDQLFKNKDKIYVLGTIDAYGKLAIDTKVSERSW